MPRIENTVAIMSSNNALAIPNFKYSEITKFVEKYWTVATTERTFPTPYWKLIKLFDQSPSAVKKIALKVSNIDDKSLVDAEWISYDDANPPEANDPSEYFVISNNYFDSESIGGTQVKGMKKHADHQKTVMVGRIGETDDGTRIILMIVANLSYKGGGPGGIGGGGATSGAKIPSQP